MPTTSKPARCGERDLIEDLRLNGGIEDVAGGDEAWIERNGDVGILKKTS